MKGFWNDKEGLSVVEILALAIGITSCAGYFYFGGIMDTNFADIAIGALIAVAGQKVGDGLTKRKYARNQISESTREGGESGV